MTDVMRPGAPPLLAPSARVFGAVTAGDGAYVAHGSAIRSVDGAVRIGHDTALLENMVVVGRPQMPVSIGSKTVFGHRCIVIGATLGDLCEIGNGTVIMPGAVLGDGCFTGEGTVIRAGAVIEAGSVVVGRPGRVIRRANAEDDARLLGLRGGDLSVHEPAWSTVSQGEETTMGTLYEYRGVAPTIDPTATVFASAEITGDVHVGAESIIGAGVKIVGDSHGPVRIGARVQILENTVLHLLPDNELVIDDDVIIGPASMIHGCHIGQGSVVEPGAIVCDFSVLGAGSVVRAGACVKQHSVFEAASDLDGFPAKLVAVLSAPPPRPGWAFAPGDLESLRRA